jgi:LysM repeat protein
MRIIKLCIGAAILMALVAAGFAHADENGAGTTAANFLTVGSGPRTLSMGGATIGIGDELGSLSWNAGALGWMNRTEVFISHAGMSNESAQEWAAIGGRFGATGTRWSLSGLYQGDGSFEGRDASNTPTGSFGASSIAIGAHVAQQFGGLVTLGVGAKSVNEKLGDVTGSGFTFDFGLQVKSGIFGFGAAAQNAFGQMAYDGSVYEFPTNYGIGAGVILPLTGLRLALDANFPNSYYKDVRFGAEYLWHDMVAVRAGYRQELNSTNDPLTGPTFGLGAGINGMWMDYGYLISDNGESQHRIALRLVPGNWGMGAGLTPFAQAGTGEPSPDKPKQPKKVAEPKTKPAEQAKAEPAPKAKKEKAQEPEKLAMVEPPAPKSAPVTTTKTEPAKTDAAKSDAAKTAPAPKAVAPAPVKTEAPKPEAPKTVEPAPKPEAPRTVEPAPKSEPAPPPTTISPAKSEPPAPEPTQSGPRPTKIKVKNGDTLKSIGRYWKVSVAALMMENNLVSENVKVGQTLILPEEGR